MRFGYLGIVPSHAKDNQLQLFWHSWLLDKQNIKVIRPWWLCTNGTLRKLSCSNVFCFQWKQIQINFRSSLLKLIACTCFKIPAHGFFSWITEIGAFKGRRIVHFRKNLVELAELQIKHAKVCYNKICVYVKPFNEVFQHNIFLLESCYDDNQTLRIQFRNGTTSITISYNLLIASMTYLVFNLWSICSCLSRLSLVTQDAVILYIQ